MEPAILLRAAVLIALGNTRVLILIRKLVTILLVA